MVKINLASAPAGDSSPKLEGAVLRDIDKNSSRYGDVDGVLVASVKRGSSAWKSGLRDGDIIVAINRYEVASVAEASQALSRAGRSITLNLVRGDTMLYVVIR